MMNSPMHVDELEARYIAVFQGIRENRFEAKRLTFPFAYLWGRHRLTRCLQRLEYYADHLNQLDAELARLPELKNTDLHRYIESLEKYSELLDLGTRVYSTLYREYREIRRLRETVTSLCLAVAAGSIALAGTLLLLG